jgi:hypothetical protein
MDDSTVQMSEKDTAYAKAIATASSCETLDQVETAKTYVRQYISMYGDGPECVALWMIIGEIEGRFPPIPQKPVEEKG